ncbi:MAG: class I SAM-dependent methyltransferase [Planctomycetota bacterium]
MAGHVCPWWGGYFIDNRLRRLLHKPERILAPYVRQGMTVIDIGCGMGFFAIAMAQSTGDDGCVIAVDVQQGMLDVLRKRAEKVDAAHRIRTHRCERNSLGIEGPVDFALAFWSAHEVPDLEGLLRQVHACLRPDGKFLVAEPRLHVSAKSFDQMIGAAEAVGMRLLEEPHVCLSRAAVLAKE